MPWGALHNYGHFVCDCLPAVATLHDTPEFREGDFVFPTLKQWHREHLHLLGVAPIELTREVYYVGNAIFTNCMATFLKAPNINFRLLASIGLDAVGCGMDSSGSGVKRKIYLSRLGNDKRRFLSERDIEGALHSRGFEIVHPETLPVAEQISLFASSAVIVGCAGAGFANVIYCPPEAVVVEIKPEGLRSNTWVRNTCLLMGCRWAPYFCGNQTRERVVVIGGREREELGISFDVDQTDFLRHVDEVTGLSPGKE